MASPRLQTLAAVQRPNTAIAHYRAVERVVRAMRLGPEQPLSLEEMSRIGYLSPFHLNRVFRNLVGIPPIQFLNALRLDAARGLLLSSELTIDEICHQVGYESLATFTRRFGEMLGAPPAQLRRLARDPASLEMQTPLSRAPESSDPEQPCMLTGHLSLPAGFQGLAFIGLFSSAIPQALPVACALGDRDGSYLMQNVPAGRYCLFSAAMPAIPGSSPYRSPAGFLRGGGEWIEFDPERPIARADIQLRPPMPFDPPILLTFPLLMRRYSESTFMSSAQKHLINPAPIPVPQPLAAGV